MTLKPTSSRSDSPNLFRQFNSHILSYHTSGIRDVEYCDPRVGLDVSCWVGVKDCLGYTYGIAYGYRPRYHEHYAVQGRANHRRGIPSKSLT